MPIKIPNQLPALTVLADENIFVISEQRAVHQDIRPIRLLLLNLMPNKIETEIQILRQLSNTPLQINVEFCYIHENAKHTSIEHLDSFYKSFDQIKDLQYDGLIITGAPLALLDYSQITYWEEICTIFDWAQQNVTSTLFSCWAAHAALYYHYGVNRQLRSNKLSGIYEHQATNQHEPLTRGFDAFFKVPHSRFGYIEKTDYLSVPTLSILAESPQAGVYLAISNSGKQIYLTGHPEYDSTTLHQEYWRDINAGKSSKLPENYYPDNDPTQQPINTWRSHGSLLFTNWLNYYVYQITPY